MMWGSDYPHAEGPYRVPHDDEVETRTVLALRHTFAHVAPELAKKMVGETAADLYGLDRDRLAGIAERIGAVNLRRLNTPLDALPAEWTRLAKTTVPFPEYQRLALEVV
jgi:hypothetical protein